MNKYAERGRYAALLVSEIKWHKIAQREEEGVLTHGVVTFDTIAVPIFLDSGVGARTVIFLWFIAVFL